MLVDGNQRCQTTSQGALSSSAGHVSTREISPHSPQAPRTFAVLFAHLCLCHKSDRVAAVSQGALAQNLAFHLSQGF